MKNDIKLFKLEPESEFELDNLYTAFLDCEIMTVRNINLEGVSGKVCQGTEEMSLTQLNLFFSNFIVSPMER